MLPPELQVPACTSPPEAEAPPTAHPRQLGEGGRRNPSPLCCGSRPQSRLRTAQPVRLRPRACSGLRAGSVTAGADRGGKHRSPPAIARAGRARSPGSAIVYGRRRRIAASPPLCPGACAVRRGAAVPLPAAMCRE